MPNPTPDPASTAVALQARPDWPPVRHQHQYGPPGTSSTPRLYLDGVTPLPPKETKSKPKGDKTK